MLLAAGVGKQSTMESITVLDNGCLCCSLREDLVAAMRGIIQTVERRLADGEPDAMIDAILIETTGVADPGPICKTFSLDPVVNAHCKIDGIITLVDAAHFLEQLGRERPADTVNEPAQQVAFADKVLLNKVDAVSRSRVARTVAAIRGINAYVPVVECSLAKSPDALPMEELLAIDAFDATKLLTEEGADLAAPGPGGGGHGHEDHAEHGHAHDPSCAELSCRDEGHEHGHEHGEERVQNAASPHDSEIGTMLLEMAGAALEVDKFQAFLEELLSERSVDLYRYKGVLAVRQRGVVVRYILQGVHDTSEVSFSGAWPEDRPVKTQVVLIGRKLERELWKQRFAECAENVELSVGA